MIGLPIGWAYGHLAEWAIHRYVLHGVGKKRGMPFSFHYHEHHRNTRSNNFRDPIYDRLRLRWDGASKEAVGLGLLALAHLPLAPVAPWFTAAAVAGGVQYYRVHRRAHVDPAWCREHLPWHYDHHMAPNQEANWGVRSDWVDRLLGTREVYLGTPKELRDRARREARAQAAASTPPAQRKAA